MKAGKLCLVFFLVLILFAGCTEAETEQNQVTREAATATAQEHQPLTENIIANPHAYSERWMSVDLPEAGLKDLTLGNYAEGHLVAPDTDDTSACTVYIFCDYPEEDSPYHSAYLAVSLGEKVLLKDLAEEQYSGSYQDTLYVCDVDGDGLDEIVVQQTVGMSGGAGSYWSRIFKVRAEEIEVIFDSLIVDAENASWDTFDTGFTSTFLRDRQVKIENTITGYSTTMDISNRYQDAFFDAEGKGTTGYFHCDSFREFTPQDVDHDGVFELVCLQYASLYGHADYIGDAKTILKYNTASQGFEVMQAEFIPAA